jgi:DNA-binding CsgD family transcriptional regulator
MTVAFAELSPAERAVLECAAQGLTVPKTALRRQVSVETVKTQRRRVLQKLGARSMTQAVRILDLELAETRQAGSCPLTFGQQKAFFGKCSALDKWLGRERGESEKLALAEASARYEREIASVKDLSELEAHETLNELEAQLRSGAA